MPELTPTPEQASALLAIETWLSEGYKRPKDLNKIWSKEFSHEEPFYTLRGYAGTGKSYAITLLVKSGLLPPESVVFTAPTNKAVKVLRNYLDELGLQACETKTIYSLLGLSLQANGEVKTLAKLGRPVDLSPYKAIIIDEASMINTFLLEAIKEASAQWKRPFIFMGDPAQLPPVGEITSPIWKSTFGAELTTVMRYGDSMLDLATDLRKVVNHPFPSIKIQANPPVFRWSKSQWLEKILENLELLKSDEAKIIAWRNVTVDKYNSFVREAIFTRDMARTNLWLPGDSIVATSPLKDLADEIFLKTDETAKILQVETGYHPKYKEYEVFNLLVLDEFGREVLIRALTPKGQSALNHKLAELSAEAKSGKTYKWREFWLLKEVFNEIRHSYAITTHRSQGSSYTKTFVDLEDILLNRNRGEAFRALYVACTRQREELHIA